MKMRNDQLKFRCWDKVNKKFVPPSHIAINGNGILLITDSGMYEKLQNKNYCNVDQEYVVQQFTGLKDKDGKEIYEGDRVRFTYVNVVDMIGGARIVDVFGEVQWCKNIASFGVLYEKYIEFKEMTNVEVIGNVFELPCNPDHNGECLVCDSWLSDCPFNKENKNEDDKVIEIMGQKFNQHWADQLIDLCKTTSVISDEQISLDLPEKYKAEFEQFMRGKTCPMLDNGQRGVYSWDFEQYLNTVLRNMKNEQK